MEEDQRPMDMSGLCDRSKGERMNEAMIRFNLINGLTYSTTGLDAVESYKAYNTTEKWFDIPHDGKTVRIYRKHIVSVERRGVK